MHLLVGNPTAQSGKNRERIEKARELLRQKGIRHDFLATLPEGQTPRAVANALRTGRFSVVIAMGGDGTFKEVAAGLLESGQPVRLAMLPTGTANDQGRSFGLSASADALERNVSVIAAGQHSPLDAGRILAYDELGNLIGRDWFFDSAGWGFSPWVLKLRNFDRKLVGLVPVLRELYRDQLVYAGAAVRAFLQTYVEERKFEAQVTLADGSVVLLNNLSELIIKNTRYYAGEWVFDPTASPEDGEMELVPLSGRTEWLKRAMVSFDRIPLPMEEIEEVVKLKLEPLHRSSRFQVRLLERPGSPGVDAQLDGEEWQRGWRFDVEVVKHAIQLITPAP